MNKESMTVHQALSELKVLDARIRKEQRELVLVTTNKHCNEKLFGVPVKDFIQDAKAKYNSVRTLIGRRNAIKRGITKSNAATKVVVGDREYTVAEAIDMKNYGMDYWKLLLSNMEMQYNSAKVLADSENGDKLERRADANIQTLFDKADTKKDLPDQIKKIREDFISAQTVEIVDTVNVTEEMKRLRDMIDAFTVNVDSALSVSNALTTIEIEYETY